MHMVKKTVLKNVSGWLTNYRLIILGSIMQPIKKLMPNIILLQYCSKEKNKSLYYIITHSKLNTYVCLYKN